MRVSNPLCDSVGLVPIQITANNTRNMEQKKALYLRIAELLAANPAIRSEHGFVNLAEVAIEN